MYTEPVANDLEHAARTHAQIYVRAWESLLLRERVSKPVSLDWEVSSITCWARRSHSTGQAAARLAFRKRAERATCCPDSASYFRSTKSCSQSFAPISSAECDGITGTALAVPAIPRLLSSYRRLHKSSSYSPSDCKPRQGKGVHAFCRAHPPSGSP